MIKLYRRTFCWKQVATRDASLMLLTIENAGGDGNIASEIAALKRSSTLSCGGVLFQMRMETTGSATASDCVRYPR